LDNDTTWVVKHFPSPPLFFFSLSPHPLSDIASTPRFRSRLASLSLSPTIDLNMARLPFVAAICSILVIFFAAVSAIQVTPGSSCAALCIDSPDGDAFSPSASTTNSTDIVCEDLHYHSTGTGIKYKNCIECLQKSEKLNGTESDVLWLIYNLRFTLDTCLFGFPSSEKTINSPCLIGYACNPLKNALLEDKLDPEKKSDFGYCNAAGDVFKGPNLKTCTQCLQTTTNQVYLANCELPFNSVSHKWTQLFADH
jgi:hypothetical protein